MRLRKQLRRIVALPSLQAGFSLLHRLALAGMNYGGAASAASSGDRVALELLAKQRIREPVVFDVGANTGGYIDMVRRIVADARITAFEPGREAFAELQRKHGSETGTTLVHAAVGAAAGHAMLFSPKPGSVLASLYVEHDAPAQPIEVICLDEYCRRVGIERVHLLKLDVEGAELDVLRGARELLAGGRVDIIQFEFGQPSLAARTYFADLFQMLSNGFDLHRVLPHGLVPLHTYHETLEVFMSTNYVAIAKPSTRIE